VAGGEVVVVVPVGPNGRTSRGVDEEGGAVVLRPLDPDWAMLAPAADGGLGLTVESGTNA
jgi:hypothetical protein